MVLSGALFADAPPEARAEVAREWWFRAWAERESTRRYARLREALIAHRAPEPIVERCRVAGEDEARHATLCAEVAARFDAHDPFADDPTPGLPLGPAGLSSADRLLYELVAFGCVTESLNAALLMAIYEGATEPVVKAAARALLADEVQHARLGWAWLDWCAGQGQEVAFLGGYVGRILTASTSENLIDGDRFCARWSDVTVGYLPRAQRVELFTGTVRGVIAPGLARYGIDPEPIHAWLAAQAWSS